MIGLDSWALGKIDHMELTDEQSKLCEQFYEEESLLTVPTFKRLQKDGKTFHCKEYTKVTKRNSYTISHSSGLYGQILIFTLRNNKPAALVQQLIPLPVPQSFSPTKAIVPVEVSTTKIISIDAIEQKLMFIQVSNTVSYVSKFPSALIMD